jgi:hypothetical protein
MFDTPETDPQPDAQHCAKCQRVLPLSAFKRYMTRAEAISKGYSGNRLVQIETKHCKDCRPPRRRNIDAFTTAELRRKAEKGLIPEALFKATKAARKEKALAAQTAGPTRRWENARMEGWKAYIAHVQAEALIVSQQKKYARKKEGVSSEMGKVLSLSEMGKVLIFCDTYLPILRRLKADLTLTARTTDLKAPDVVLNPWHTHLTKDEKDAVARAWTAINPNTTNRMRPPAAFSASRFGVPILGEEGPEEDSQ